MRSSPPAPIIPRGLWTEEVDQGGWRSGVAREALTYFIAIHWTPITLPTLSPVIARSCVMEMPTVRELIVSKMRDGALPRTPAVTVYGGVGSDSTCCCCDQTISRTQFEIEVMFDPSSMAQTRFMHPQCLRLWYEECGP